MHPSVIDWVRMTIQAGQTAGDIVEVGSYDVNGTVRPLFHHARSYVGLDVVAGPGVDVVYDGLTIPLPDRCADIVVSTEMLEHCEQPWSVVAEMARLLRPGGLLALTARGWVVTRRWHDSAGVEVGEVATFAFHNPPDRWRFSGDAMSILASAAGLDVWDVCQDPQVPGWFVAATKPATV